MSGVDDLDGEGGIGAMRVARPQQADEIELACVRSAAVVEAVLQEIVVLGDDRAIVELHRGDVLPGRLEVTDR